MKSKDESTKKFKEITYEDHDTTKPIYKFEPDFVGHEWKQQGPYLVCQSCDLKHATFIGINKIMVGINANGKPILNRR